MSYIIFKNDKYNEENHHVPVINIDIESFLISNLKKITHIFAVC
jgi:hypothetical protein